VVWVHAQMRVSERRVCRALGHARSFQRYVPSREEDEERIAQRVVELAAEYGRYGSPRITALMRQEGYGINHNRVERIWREEGLKVPKRQPKRGRLWRNDGSCIRLRPERRDQVWAYDFVQDWTHDGRSVRMLTIVDE